MDFNQKRRKDYAKSNKKKCIKLHSKASDRKQSKKSILDFEGDISSESEEEFSSSTIEMSHATSIASNANSSNISSVNKSNREEWMTEPHHLFPAGIFGSPKAKSSHKDTQPLEDTDILLLKNPGLHYVTTKSNKYTFYKPNYLTMTSNTAPLPSEDSDELISIHIPDDNELIRGHVDTNCRVHTNTCASDSSINSDYYDKSKDKHNNYSNSKIRFSNKHENHSKSNIRYRNKHENDGTTNVNPDYSKSNLSATSRIIRDDLNSLHAELLKAELSGDQVKIDLLKCQISLKNTATNRNAENHKQMHTNNDRQREDRRKGKPFKATRSFRTECPRIEFQSSGSSISKTSQSLSKLGSVGNKIDDDLLFDQLTEEVVTKSNRKSKVLDAVKDNITMDDCIFCMENDIFQSHLVIDLGSYFYIKLPSRIPLSEGQCEIVPLQHVATSLLLDENVFSELVSMKQKINNIFTSQGKDVIFIETCTNANKLTHLRIDCIPLAHQEGAQAPLYFRKALLECEDEWNNNIKLIDTRGKKLSACIPKKLPFFSVEFGVNGGYAHVIEDLSLFPKYFGFEIIGNILNLEPRRWLNPKRETPEKLAYTLKQFKHIWLRNAGFTST